MKRIRLFFVLIVLSGVLCVSCAAKQATQPDVEPTQSAQQTQPTPEPTEAPQAQPMRIATLAGPTGMGLIDLVANQNQAYEISIYTAPDQLTPKIINNEVDAATIPSNLAAVLYNKTGGAIQVTAVNTLGVLYILENGDSVNAVADLAGKTIYATGQGSTPEYVLNDILTQNGLTVGVDVTVEYLSEHADLANMMAAGDAAIALLPEPFVSTVLVKNQDVKVKIDMDQEWKKLYGEESALPMGVTVVQKQFIQEHPELVEKMMQDYAASVDFVVSNTENAATLIEENGIIGSAAIAKQAIPRCQISFITGQEAKDILSEYFDLLFKSNPASVGGALPDEGLYLIQ